jgi:sn1-specific diacylglycerol lipase
MQTWADPHTCKTVPSSGLPSGRRVSIYCFGPPCVTDVALGKLSRNMITSFVYSHDVVSRLSLGSVRDMTRSAAWLCAAARNDREDAKEEGHTALTTRALKYRAGLGKEEDAEWVSSFLELEPLSS